MDVEATLVDRDALQTFVVRDPLAQLSRRRCSHEIPSSHRAERRLHYEDGTRAFLRHAEEPRCYVRMTVSKLRLFDANDRVVVVQRISTSGDKEALSIARSMLKDALAVAKFDPRRHDHGLGISEPGRLTRRSGRRDVLA